MPRSAILNGITKDMRGIEIAPWFAPLAPKRHGFNCLVVDVFSKDELSKRAAADHNIPDKNVSLIEHVDIVGSATEISSLIPVSEHGTFDYIISSHNFEHLPNPIKFLRASGETSTYEDAHCSVMTPASFELLILECRHLGLLSLEIESVSEPEGCEFFVRLVNSRVACAVPDISAARTTLMRKTLEEGQIQRTRKMLLRNKKWTMRKRFSLNYIRAILEEIVESINGVLPGLRKAS